MAIGSALLGSTSAAAKPLVLFCEYVLTSGCANCSKEQKRTYHVYFKIDDGVFSRWNPDRREYTDNECADARTTCPLVSSVIAVHAETAPNNGARGTRVLDISIFKKNGKIEISRRTTYEGGARARSDYSSGEGYCENSMDPSD